MSAPVVAEIVRSGFVEGHHYGSIVALERDGSVAWSVGDVESQILPRSCNKPVQATAMVRCGLTFEGELLALASASHSGEEFHIDGVRKMLSGAGLSEEDLQTPPDWPLNETAKRKWIQAGNGKSSIAMNCSGKHAGMLATCVENGWPTASYRDPDHPLQLAIKDTFAELTEEPVKTVAVDGCGAPLLSTSLTGLARAFRTVSLATDGAEAKVAQAIRQHPEFVSGTKRDERKVIRAIPGAIAKAGAESCYALGLPDGRAIAIKTDDGASRARPVLMAAALERLGVLDEPGVDAEVVRETGRHVLYGGGQPVGEIRACF